MKITQKTKDRENELRRKQSRAIPDMNKGLKKNVKVYGNIHRNSTRGACPICGKDIRVMKNTNSDGSRPYIRLILDNPHMNGLYYCHLECYHKLYKCIKITIEHNAKDYLPYEL